MDETPPPELIRQFGPDAQTKLVIENLERLTLCGGRFTVVWKNGPWKGLPVTAFCWRPGCVETGRCTGARFIPHLDQFDRPMDAEGARRRKISVQEAIAMVRLCARKATGKDDPRSDKEILADIEHVHARMLPDRGGQWAL